MKRFLIIAAMALSSCDRDQPPAPSAEQSARLDEAEDMLNDMGKEEGAAPNGTAPPDSNAN